MGLNRLLSLFYLVLLNAFTGSAFAVVDSVQAPPPTVAAAGSSGECSYYYSDVFNGTIPPISYPTGTNIALQFYNNGTPSATGPDLPCDGTYKVVFELGVRANTNVSQVTITPSITDSNGSVIYPSGSNPTELYLYPQCQKASFSSTPYCTMGTISGSSDVTITAPAQINAPILNATSSITVLSGTIIIYYVPPSS